MILCESLFFYYFIHFRLSISCSFSHFFFNYQFPTNRSKPSPFNSTTNGLTVLFPSPSTQPNFLGPTSFRLSFQLVHSLKSEYFQMFINLDGTCLRQHRYLFSFVLGNSGWEDISIQRNEQLFNRSLQTERKGKWKIL